MDRSELSLKDTWQLEDIYKTDQEWAEAKERIGKEAKKLVDFKGKLGTSHSQLAAFFEMSSAVSMELSKLSSYASLKSDQDTRESGYLAMKQEISQLATEIGVTTSYAEPEILAIGKDTINMFISENDALLPYKMYLHDLFRKQEHRLSAPEEAIMSQASMLMRGPYSIYNIFTNAEFPYPQVTLENGDKATIDLAGYSKYRATPNPFDRELVFKEFWSAINKFQRTLAEQLYSQINTSIFRQRTRKYNSCLENALDGFNIPVEVYHSLIKNVNSNLDSFHRYLRLRKKLLGLETLKYSDMYAPVGNDTGLSYEFDKAQEFIVNSMEPLGKEYQKILHKAYKERWIDIYPNTGKRSGAYCNGSVYDGHPYVLLNFNGLPDDVSTYTHEMGHAMHSYYSNKTQPYPTSRYSIFVAEVASTFNEALLAHYMQQHCEDKSLRLPLLLKALDGFKGTLFRQTQFAEFELFIHQKVENNEAITADILNNAYGSLLQKYYGHSSGVCHINELYHIEWAYIPHFYYNFYVYQYSTSFVASMALAEQVLKNEPGAKERYLTFLSSGSSDYPIELLKKAGVDMTTDAPFDNAITNMNRIIDEIEVILIDFKS